MSWIQNFKVQAKGKHSCLLLNFRTLFLWVAISFTIRGPLSICHQKPKRRTFHCLVHSPFSHSISVIVNFRDKIRLAEWNTGDSWDFQSPAKQKTKTLRGSLAKLVEPSVKWKSLSFTLTHVLEITKRTKRKVQSSKECYRARVMTQVGEHMYSMLEALSLIPGIACAPLWTLPGLVLITHHCVYVLYLIKGGGSQSFLVGQQSG